MTSKISLAGALAAIIACTMPAHANWETTHWGMSPEEALAALDGASSHPIRVAELVEYGGNTYAPLVKLSDAIEGVEGEISLMFDADKALRFVSFNPSKVSNCDALSTALLRTHGPAETSGFGKTVIYNWQDNGDIVRFTNSKEAGFCALSYGEN